MPQETAATWSVNGMCLRAPSLTSFCRARCKATKDPVIAAVRVPPSACNTSQSIFIWRSPSAFRSVTALRERPMRRWISWVRPLCLPRAASRSVLVWVERGSIPYSAVTQPEPELRRNGGTRSSTDAVQSTCVSPNLTQHDPSAYFAKPGSSVTARICSALRPDGRFAVGVITLLLFSGHRQAIVAWAWNSH